ncbi:hypothetical protein PCASD_23514 [Puccinia coronata f. sp. avenae]|uniref:Uncharacterized protein n=1 Tax=Puccinia coronata f. sp. avenae TaxID=200324 RepID=A0A2N5S8U0_9BASI|nr:hypothetical protein PCASD_23514 [Puccinia coronata f. sp. avenae]
METPSAAEKSNKSKSDIDKLWDKISETITVGNRSTAKLLLRMYTKLQSAPSSLSVPPSIERSSLLGRLFGSSTPSNMIL